MNDPYEPMTDAPTGGDPGDALDLLDRMRLRLPGEQVQIEALSGGVSSDIWLIRSGSTSFVVKRPLEQLKVAADWRAPIDRGASEMAWLAYVDLVVPGACPKVLAYDRETFAIALEYLDPATHLNWKSQLMAGDVDAGFAGAVGRDLGRIHGASARTPELQARFDHQDLLESLRIEPYFLRTAEVVPEVRDELHAIVDGLRGTRIALVHGDVSPKNILVGERPVFLDAECATWSDPAFDAAFCLTHLRLKEIHRPAHAEAFANAARAFESAYLAEADWEAPEQLRDRIARIIPALMLARVAGASPVEYLDDAARRTVGRLARSALRSGRSIDETLQEEGAAHG